MKRILVVGTADTKGEELAYLKSAIADAGAVPIVVDVGIGAPSVASRLLHLALRLGHLCGVRDTAADGR